MGWEGIWRKKAFFGKILREQKQATSPPRSVRLWQLCFVSYLPFHTTYILLCHEFQAFLD